MEFKLPKTMSSRNCPRLENRPLKMLSPIMNLNSGNAQTKTLPRPKETEPSPGQVK